MDKKIAQRIHAKKRAAERYGLVVNRVTLRDWATLIQTGKAIKLEIQSNRVSVYLIEYDGQQIKVVYDRLRKTIVTCLPVKASDVEQKQEEKIN